MNLFYELNSGRLFAWVKTNGLTAIITGERGENNHEV